jgi:hypothetical protein
VRLPIIGGAYATRSVIGSNYRSINLFPEENRKDGPPTWTLYQRPGYRQLAPGQGAVGRGVYRASNGNGYAVIGQGVYSISPAWVLTQIGQLNTPGSNLVSMIDNGVTLLLVDASTFGYEITLNTNAFSLVVDPTGIFTGALKVDYIDGFVLWNLIGSPGFGSTLDNEISFDATFTAAKNGYPDLLQTLLVNNRQILLFGTLKSEIWYDAGGTLFPFAELPGAYIEHGCLAPYSVACYDNSAFWLGQDLYGRGFVFRQRGYKTTTISSPALSFAIRKMAKAGADLSDAIGYCYVDDGHVFYVLTFVSGDQTWVFDDLIGDPMAAWHQRSWSDANGVLHRERAISHAFLNGKNVVQDWESGALYELDPDHYFDDVAGVSGPVSYIRGLPVPYQGLGLQGPQLLDGETLVLNHFVADMECGEGPLDINGLPPSVSLRVSSDRGKTFDQTVLQSNGKPGQYETSPKWGPLGLKRFPMLEVEYSFAGPAALNGGWLNATVTRV